MYELDSPLKKRENITKSQSGSTFELERIRKLAVATFKSKKSPLRYKQAMAVDDSLQQEEAKFDLDCQQSGDRLRVPLTDRKH